VQRHLNIADSYDIAVIGGGIHGAAIAWEAARNGYSVLLVERRDFVSGASSNSLKIIHGGLRYLQGLDWSRSRASALEQERLMKLAPHWIRPLPCAMPTYGEFMKSRLALRAGLWLYDHCIRSRAMARQWPGSVSTLDRLSQLAPLPDKPEMTGVARWYDAQVHNSERLVLAYLWSARALGAQVVNHTGLEVAADMSRGVRELTLTDKVTGTIYRTAARHLVDTAAVMPDDHRVELVRGVNLVLTERLSDWAIGLAHRSHQVRGHAASRLLFFTPWRNVTLVGTWYFADRPELGDKVSRDELDECVDDVAAVWPQFAAAASRPEAIHVGRLPVTAGGRSVRQLLERPRIELNARQQITRVTGVKYTTARLVAGETVSRLAGHVAPSGAAAALVLHGAEFHDLKEFYVSQQQRYADMLPAPVLRRLVYEYGSEMDQVMERCRVEQNFDTIVDADDVLQVEVAHAVEDEMAVHLDDVLLRRLGIGTARRAPAATINHCTQLMAHLMNWDAERSTAEKARMLRYYERVVPAPVEN
jgi:glycerol-3-phosphate dehydrogenase